MTRIVVFGLTTALCLYGQYGGKKFSWQDSCFNNPGLPYCQGRDFAVKKNPKNPKDASTSNGVVTGSGSSAPEHVTPSVITVGAIEWRFADPAADAIVGFDLGGLSASPLGHSLIVQLGAQQGISEGDMQRVLDRLAGVGQVVISVHNGRAVALATGAGDSAPPALEPGWKADRISGGAMLVGHEDAVDEALERIATQGPLGELIRLSKERQAASDFWAVGSAAVAGPEAQNADLKRFALSVLVRNNFASEVALQFGAAPSENGLRIWPGLTDANVDRNEAYLSTSTDPQDAQQKVKQLAASPLGERLASLVTANRYLPVHDTSLPKQTKPVIYGLDSGPKVVGQ